MSIAPPQYGWNVPGVLRFVCHIPRNVLILIVKLYQVTLSPLVGKSCRYLPTCSNYCIEALQRHGAIRGTLMGTWRIMRCHPWAKGGYDPVK